LKLFSERRKNPPPPRDSTLQPKPAGQTVAPFREGLRTLPDVIAKQLLDEIKCDIYCRRFYFFICRLQWKLTDIKEGDDGMFTLTYETPEGDKSIQSKTVALTVPSYVAADLLQDLSVG